MEALPLLVVKVIPALDKDVIDGNQLNDLALRQIGRLIEDQSPALNSGLERLHDARSLLGGGPDRHDAIARRRAAGSFALRLERGDVGGPGASPPEDLDDDQLARGVGCLLRGDDALPRRQIRIVVRGSVLKRRGADDVFRSLLHLEEAWTERSVVARWAFDEGWRAGRDG